MSGQNTRDMAAPSVFEPSVGAMVPASVALRAWPSQVTGRIPAVRPYAYAVLDTKVLIVNPTDKKIGSSTSLGINPRWEVAAW